jgi:hypothetical protein
MTFNGIVKALGIGVIAFIAYYLVTTYYGGHITLPSIKP